MKTNHRRGFTARTEDSHNRRVHNGFKSFARKVFRRAERKALLAITESNRDTDEVVFPSKNVHGEDVWYHD